MRGLVLLLLVAACASPSAKQVQDAPDTATSDPSTLSAGTTDLALDAGPYYSPVDFVPALALGKTSGWHSLHRKDDAFDLTYPGVVTVSFLTPTGETVAPTLGNLHRGTPLTGTLVGQHATGFAFTGGTGELVHSSSGTVKVLLEKGDAVHVLGVDVDQVPLLVVIDVPAGSHAAQGFSRAQALLDSVTGG